MKDILTQYLFFQAALTSLEREAKENVYAVLDPHIQYEITINKHGEPPKYLSLSKPLMHQRTLSSDPNIKHEINNNDFNENPFSTFKQGPPKARRSNRGDRNNHANNQSYVCKTNNDIEYTKDPYFGIARGDNVNTNEYRSSKNYSRMYERNSSGRKDRKDNNIKQDVKRASNRSSRGGDKKVVKEKERERSFEEFDAPNNMKQDFVEEDYKPKPGKVKEIASKFNRDSMNVLPSKKKRPKPLQSFCNQAYLDHIFPDAVEV